MWQELLVHNHKCIFKLRSFSSSKFRCMHEHVKPNIQDFSPHDIIFYCGTNDLGSQRTACQIARSTIKITLLLKSQNNKISISLMYQEMTTLITKPVK